LSGVRRKTFLSPMGHGHVTVFHISMIKYRNE
jgi:hypothetical protein